MEMVVVEAEFRHRQGGLSWCGLHSSLCFMESGEISEQAFADYLEGGCVICLGDLLNSG